MCLSAIFLFFSSRTLFAHASLVTPWLGLIVVVGAFRGVVANRFFTHPYVFTIGGMCYTIYRYHFGVVGLCGHGRLFLFPSFWPDLALTLILVPVAILTVSGFLFVFLEKPFMRRNWHTRLFNYLARRTGFSTDSGTQ